MLFFLSQEAFEKASGGRTFLTDALNDLAITVEGGQQRLLALPGKNAWTGGCHRLVFELSRSMSMLG